MSKLIKNRDGNFTHVKNDIFESGLSAKAMGIFCYLWHLPDDWKFYEDEITTHFKDGKASIRTGIKELEEHGFLKRIQSKDSKSGKFRSFDWQLNESPLCDFPKAEKPTADNPTSENRKLQSTKRTKYLSTNINNNGAPESPNSFELYESITGKQLNSIQQAKFVDWIGRLGNELVIHAIQYAQSQNSPNFGFIDSVLNEWEKSRTDNNKISVVDVASANAYQAVRQRQLEKRIQANHYRTTNKTKKEGKEDGARW